MRLGPGPVFAYEWLTTTRRWQLYALRAGFVGVILAGMILVWQTVRHDSNPGRPVSIQTLARYGESFYVTVVVIELTLVLLAAPAATAGAVCLDKARGTLDHMLATDLSNAEIVLGKLGVRLVPVLGLIACALPVAALGGLLGGIDPTALLGSFLTAIACAFLGCSLALTLSVWGRKTHEVLMITYLILILWLIGPLLVALVVMWLPVRIPGPAAQLVWEWRVCTNPYSLAFAPYTYPGKVGMTTFLGFLGVCLGLSMVFLGLATLRIRGVAIKQAGQGAVQSRNGRFALHVRRPRWLPRLPGPSLDGNPVLWREWQRSKPSRFLRAVWLLYSALGALWIVLSLRITSAVRGDLDAIGVMNVFQVAVGLLLLSANAATSLAEERARGSLDLLLSTPLSTHSILAAKWLGSFQHIAHVLVWPAVTGAFLVADSGRWFSYLMLLGLIMAYGAGITSLGLALATWISRLGRAVAACVSAYIVFSVGWVCMIALVSSGHYGVLPVLMGSPLFGTFLATAILARRSYTISINDAPSVTGCALLWIVIHGGVAALLFAATVATFDRCLGRVAETPGRAINRPPKRPPAEPDLDLDEWPVDDPAEVL